VSPPLARSRTRPAAPRSFFPPRSPVLMTGVAPTYSQKTGHWRVLVPCRVFFLSWQFGNLFKVAPGAPTLPVFWGSFCKLQLGHRRGLFKGLKVPPPSGGGSPSLTPRTPRPVSPRLPLRTCPSNSSRLLYCSNWVLPQPKIPATLSIARAPAVRTSPRILRDRSSQAMMDSRSGDSPSPDNVVSILSGPRFP